MDVNSAFDFDGLQSIKNQARRDPLSAPGSAATGPNAANATPGSAPAGASNPALRKAAEQFEALFIQEMLKSMRASIEKDELTSNQHLETYESLFDREVSLQMAKRGSVGLADMLVKHMEKQLPQPTADVLSNRAVDAAQNLLRQESAAPKGKPLDATLYGKGLPVKPSIPFMPGEPVSPSIPIPRGYSNLPLEKPSVKAIR
jgi:Rod binding domain-containing protein